jgi:UDP-glucose 4-epimerase
VKLRENPLELEILGDGWQVRSYIYIDDAVEATMTAWRKTSGYFEVYNVASEDWITINELADIVIETMGLKNVEKKYKPILHGVGWLRDVKKIALKVDKVNLAFLSALSMISSSSSSRRFKPNELDKPITRARGNQYSILNLALY